MGIVTLKSHNLLHPLGIKILLMETVPICPNATLCTWKSIIKASVEFSSTPCLIAREYPIKLSNWLYLCIYNHWSIYLFIYLFVYWFIHLFTYWFNCSFIHIFIFIFVYLFIPWFIYLVIHYIYYIYIYIHSGYVYMYIYIYYASPVSWRLNHVKNLRFVCGNIQKEERPQGEPSPFSLQFLPLLA